MPFCSLSDKSTTLEHSFWHVQVGAREARGGNLAVFVTRWKCMPRQGWRYTLQSREALSFSSSRHQQWRYCNIKLWPFLNLLYTFFFKLHSHKLKQWLNKHIQNVIKLKITAHYREKIGTIYHSREYFFYPVKRTSTGKHKEIKATFPFLAFTADSNLYPLGNIPRNKIFLEDNTEVLPKKKGKGEETQTRTKRYKRNVQTKQPLQNK